jgi:hypothetical protein
MPDRSILGERHRATYILELGVWRATCRACDYSTTDPNRRRVASVFRNHIRDIALHADLDCAEDRSALRSGTDTEVWTEGSDAGQLTP